MIKLFRFFPMVLIVAAIGLSVSCKKVVDNPGDGGDNPPTVNSKLLYDSLYLYAKEFYLWNDQLPASLTDLNPSQYYDSDDSTGLDNELYALVKNVKNKEEGYYYEYVQGSKYSKYSSLVSTLSEINGGEVSLANRLLRESTTLNDSRGDGIGLFLFADIVPGSKEIGWFVWYVNTGSPAYEAGLRRGQFVEKINDNVFGSSDNDLNEIDALLKGDKINITIKNLETEKETKYSLNTDHNYEWNPIMKDTVIKASGQSVGYIAYQAFADPVTSKKYLDAAFKKFEDAGVKKMIVDLRYNYGGFVETANIFANLLIPSGNNGSVLYVEHFNKNLNKKVGEYSASTKALLKSQKIYEDDLVTPTGGTYLDYTFDEADNTFKVNKLGDLNGVTDLVFIVSRETASASELLINSLKPYLNVSLVGVLNTPQEFESKNVRTYGKPVGFFPIRIGPFTLYTPNFYTSNKEKFSDYYQGFLAVNNGYEDVTADFGASTDPESAFGVAMKKLVPSFKPIASARSIRRTESNVSRSLRLNQKRAGLRETPIKGIMIERPRSIRQRLN